MTESTDRAPRLTGGCQCGKVRYALFADPQGVHLCHCRMCQRAVGGPFAALAPVRVDDFAWTSGRPAFYPSSNLAERGFCRDCGTPLSFRYLTGEWIDVTLGSLDAPDQAVPVENFGVESRLSWLDRVADLPGHETGDYPGGPETLAGLASNQAPPRSFDQE
ncbi:aldehyde-activating protein [Rhodospirillum rubrum]|uniref:GFA family protein n=1 Tax=Rhodospirillum rubrum TaxID=1085 RepID=UPI00190762A4|nr:GFA family protein [Rhodospirillum rubrum]MBK1664582.1 aldehyde-activating protein [Rhodospirillum rubrum]MBK1676753.1 aldehyde-activating protein [Rhodospirillum rubrum]